eukprot:2936494-Rhodomonas_salina.1
MSRSGVQYSYCCPVLSWGTAGAGASTSVCHPRRTQGPASPFARNAAIYGVVAATFEDCAVTYGGSDVTICAGYVAILGDCHC